MEENTPPGVLTDKKLHSQEAQEAAQQMVESPRIAMPDFVVRPLEEIEENLNAEKKQTRAQQVEQFRQEVKDNIVADQASEYFKSYESYHQATEDAYEAEVEAFRDRYSSKVKQSRMDSGAAVYRNTPEMTAWRKKIENDVALTGAEHLLNHKGAKVITEIETFIANQCDEKGMTDEQKNNVMSYFENQFFPELFDIEDIKNNSELTQEQKVKAIKTRLNENRKSIYAAARETDADDKDMESLYEFGGATEHSLSELSEWTNNIATRLRSFDFKIITKGLIKKKVHAVKFYHNEKKHNEPNPNLPAVAQEWILQLNAVTQMAEEAKDVHRDNTRRKQSTVGEKELRAAAALIAQSRSSENEIYIDDLTYEPLVQGGKITTPPIT